VCVKGISQVTSISKGSPGEETNSCYSSANAYTYDNTSKNSLSKSSDGQGITNFREKQIIKTQSK
jgi:hypothetical protein